jgi:hypothetical protein
MHHTALMTALILVVGCLASRAANSHSIGFEGVKPGMTRQAIAQMLAERGLPITDRSDGAIETKIFDTAQSPITVLFGFQPQQDAVALVEFQVTGPPSSRIFLEWLSQQLGRWGNGKTRNAGLTSLREDFCAGRNVNVVVTLFQNLASLTFHYSANSFMICLGEQSAPPSSPTQYALPPVLANRVAIPAPVAPPRTVESGTNSYEELMRCIPVMIFVSGRVGDEVAKKAIDRNIEASMSEMIQLGRSKGLSKDQVIKEFRSSPHPFPPKEADMDYCRARKHF